jgi:integrase
MTAAAGPWRDVLPGAAVMAPRELPRARSVLALLARFAAGQGIPASPRWLLDYDVIEAFCVRGCAGRAPATRGTYRSVLYRLAAPVHGVPGQRGTPFPGSEAPAPYSPAERAELAAIARAQRDPARRASALAIVVFGIGAGLRPGELAALRGTDAAQAGGRVIVRVAGGPAARTVPVAACYDGRALRLAREAGAGFVFRPGPADRAYKNFVNFFAQSLTVGPGAPAVSAGRCRASFICGHLAAGTPVPVLLAISGIAGLNASKAALRARWLAERTQ